MRTMEQMKENAQRQLDGMTTNRDQMARDVIRLADEVKMLREEAAKKNAYSAFADIAEQHRRAKADEIMRAMSGAFGGQKP